MKTSRQSLSIILVLFVLFIANHSFATIHEVSTSGELSSAISEAADGDVIILAAGNYHMVDGNKISTGLTMRGESDDPAETVIYLDYLTQGIIAEEGFAGDEAVKLENLTFTYFDVMTTLLSHDGLLVLDNCIFQFIHAINIVGNGGGLEARDCLFTGISAARIIQSQAETLLQDCQILQNDIGHVVEMEQGHLTVSSCDLSGNHGYSVQLRPFSTADLSHCLFESNSNGIAAVRLDVESSVTMDSCSFLGNAYTRGAVFLDLLSEAALLNCDISECGFLDGFTMPASTLTLVCCDVDLDQWDISGELIIDNDDCTVGTVVQTLGGMKSLFKN